jgi:hypothetical protein
MHCVRHHRHDQRSPRTTERTRGRQGNRNAVEGGSYRCAHEPLVHVRSVSNRAVARLVRVRRVCGPGFRVVADALADSVVLEALRASAHTAGRSVVCREGSKRSRPGLPGRVLHLEVCQWS